MNIHRMIDVTSISIGSKFFPKYFRDGIDTPSFSEHLRQVVVMMPDIYETGDYEVVSDTLSGKIGSGFRVAQWLGAEYPSIIYHHGANEIPFDYGFRHIFPHEKVKIPANLFLIRAPFHKSRKEFSEGLATLSNFVMMMAVSVALIEQVVEHIKKESDQKVLVAGSSLGGFITNLHHIYFHSADVYTPLIAGTAIDDAFLNSVYSKSVSEKAKSQPEKFGKIMNFKHDFATVSHQNVFPLLARHDAIIRYDVQKKSYGACPVETFEKGHATGALSYKVLRNHMLKHLQP